MHNDGRKSTPPTHHIIESPSCIFPFSPLYNTPLEDIAYIITLSFPYSPHVSPPILKSRKSCATLSSLPPLPPSCTNHSNQIITQRPYHQHNLPYSSTPSSLLLLWHSNIPLKSPLSHPLICKGRAQIKPSTKMFRPPPSPTPPHPSSATSIRRTNSNTLTLRSDIRLRKNSKSLVSNKSQNSNLFRDSIADPCFLKRLTGHCSFSEMFMLCFCFYCYSC